LISDTLKPKPRQAPAPKGRLRRPLHFGRGVGDRAAGAAATRTETAALAAGFIAPEDAPGQRRGVLEIMTTAGEPLRHEGPYDFGASNLVARSMAQGREQFFGEGYARPPLPELIFFQRKFAGTLLLSAGLNSRVELQKVFAGEL